MHVPYPCKGGWKNDVSVLPFNKDIDQEDVVPRQNEELKDIDRAMAGKAHALKIQV